MATFEGIYNSVLRGVSQQVPQEREDGQLGEQLNMLSDPVTGLRRRGGIKFIADIMNLPNTTPYIKLVDINGIYYIMAIDTTVGKISIFSQEGTFLTEYLNQYLVASKISSIRSVVSRNNCYIVNTEKVPKKQVTGDNPAFDPKRAGYISIRSSAFGKQFTANIKWGTNSKDVSWTAHSSDANEASPATVAARLAAVINADPLISPVFLATVDGVTIALKAKDGVTPEPLVVTTGESSVYMMVSNSQRVAQRTELLGTLPPALDGFTMAVGTLSNSSYYRYSKETNTWKEVGKWEPNYRITDEPLVWTYDSSVSSPFVFKSLGIKIRSAGDDENNPLPKFIDYGITGIGTYQSRLILLAGSYVTLSKTTDFSEYSRTTVTELLDTDAIEVASASLSSAQFEYAVPYNKDLVLISRTHQAVIPSNSTVLTPKTAVIYPSNEVELSLATEPVVVARSLYFAYQRGSEFFQIGEFIPNSYTDAQYLDQGLMDHLPLYATGVCTNISVSSTNNMVVMSSNSKEVLINQYRWQGDERVLLSFHKWVLPHKVIYSAFVQDILYLVMQDSNGKLILGSLNVQLNQLDDKPTPYLDLYHFVTITDGSGVVRFDTAGMVASVYSEPRMRHQPTYYRTTGSTIRCPYDGTIVLGYPYTSLFSITPPFLKDQSGKVLAGVKSTVHSLRMTFKATSTFKAFVQDAMGISYDYSQDTALTWSETDVGIATINNIGSVTIPCRTQMSSTECSISTDSTTDMNVVSIEFIIRYQGKHRRL